LPRFTTICGCTDAEVRVMSNNRPNAPDWFQSKSYEHLSTLSLSAWQYEIERCDWLRTSEPGQYQERPEVPGYIGTVTVQLVPKGEVTLHRLEKPALIIQLDAPDGIILKKVKEALAIARKTYPASARKPGRKSFNAQFTKKQITTWLNHKIVELSELDNWRRGLPEQSAPTDADFGSWLFSSYADPGKQIVTARKVLADAIASVPALWAQSEAGTLEHVTSN
jgi:hypothetical protein